MVTIQQESLTRQILAHIAECGKGLIGAFLPRNYPESMLTRDLLGLERCPHRFPRERQATISSLLTRLRREGLVARSGPRKKSSWRITPKGVRRLRKKPLVVDEGIDYILPKPDGKIRLIAFDVPEQDRKKRDWLRAQLIACEYQLLQKSVWVGTRPLPEELMEELDALDLSRHIHLVNIRGKGTILDGLK